MNFKTPKSWRVIPPERYTEFSIINNKLKILPAICIYRSQAFSYFSTKMLPRRYPLTFSLIYQAAQALDFFHFLHVGIIGFFYHMKFRRKTLSPQKDAAKTSYHPEKRQKERRFFQNRIYIFHIAQAQKHHAEIHRCFCRTNGLPP